jgi:hypothetical protein
MSALERYKFHSKPLDLDLFRAMSADLIAKSSSKFGGATVTGATSGNGNLANDLNAALPNSETHLGSLKFTFAQVFFMLILQTPSTN